MTIWLCRKLLKLREVNFAILSGIMLSLGGNYLSSDEPGPAILGKAIAWILSGAGMILLGDILRDSREVDLRLQRAKLLTASVSGDAASVAIRQMAVLEPRQEEMIERIRTLKNNNRLDAVKLALALLLALFLPSVLATLLVAEKLQ